MSSDGSVSSRIDLVGCPYVWVPCVLSCDILPFPYSDHCAVLLRVTAPDVVPQGPGVWKLNISILEDEEYVRQVGEFWSNWRGRKSQFPSLGKWWEEGKSRVKGLSIRYCCSKSSASSVRRDLLSRLSAHLKERVDNGHLSLVLWLGFTNSCFSSWLT